LLHPLQCCQLPLKLQLLCRPLNHLQQQLVLGSLLHQQGLTGQVLLQVMQAAVLLLSAVVGPMGWVLMGC
jgi:hypothetical protein